MGVLPRGRKAWIRAGILWGGLLGAMGALGTYMMGMPGDSHVGPLPPLTRDELALEDALKRHVRALAGEIGERNVFHPEALAAAAEYLERELSGLGYVVDVQEFEARGIPVRNLAAEIPGASRADEIIIVGAHYDSVRGSPGANDNATGVAAALEIARSSAGRRPARTIRFVLLVNEEPPFFGTDLMGSRVYARRSRERGERITAMVSLETIGCYDDEPGSQRYPFPFGFFYPSAGRFVAFVGNLSSRTLVRRSIGSFRDHTSFPSEGIAAPARMPGIGLSDHSSFWKEGYPAIMVTDTAPFRYDPYHTREDTPDQVRFDRMARVVAGIARVVAEIAGEPAPAHPRER